MDGIAERCTAKKLEKADSKHSDVYRKERLICAMSLLFPIL
jgi:hypothetical protein